MNIKYINDNAYNYFSGGQMARHKTKKIPSYKAIKGNKEIELELARKTKISPIARNREKTLKIKFADPRTLENFYITIPEVGRAVDLRSAEVVRRGYEITPYDASSVAEDNAVLCYEVLEGHRREDNFDKGGGVETVERFFKNADVYGISYLELVPNDQEQIISLEPVHPFLFGFIEEEPKNNGLFANADEKVIAIDETTGNPKGYAQYKINEMGEREIARRLKIDEVAYMSFRGVGDNFLGVSLIQRMYNDVVRGMSIKQSISDASDMTIPKVVVTGEYRSEGEQEREAEKFANLSSDDVIIINQGKEIEIIQPGTTQIPDFYDIFISGITTTSGVPKPLLLSDGTETNKATLAEMSKKFRTALGLEEKILQRRMRWIFKRILESYGRDTTKVPFFTFPEDPETEEARLNRETKKATTLANLANSVSALANQGVGSEVIDVMTTTMVKIAETYFRNDDITRDTTEELQLELNQGIPIDYGYSLFDRPEDLRRPEKLNMRHKELHDAYDKMLKGGKVFEFYNTNDGFDSQGTKEITMPDLVAKHQLYVKTFNDIGLVHPHWDGLDDIADMMGKDVVKKVVIEEPENSEIVVE